MNQNGRSNKQGDKLLKMPGKFDRGPVEFESRIVEQEGQVMGIATRDVVAVAQTATIINAVETMTTCGFRRLPIVDPGTRKMRGIVTASDIISLMGGGDRYSLVTVKHGGNLIAAINESVREVMSQQFISLTPMASIQDAINLIVEKKIGGLPILDDQGVLQGIVTERDLMRLFETERSMLTVEEIMSSRLRVIGPDSPISAVTKEMVKHTFRRLPVVSDEVLFGIITSTDIVKYLGTGQVFDQLVTGDIGEVMGLPVRTLMSGDLISTTPDTSITQAAREMLDKGIGALPVIENSRLIGLVTEFDLVKAFAGR